MNAVKGLKHHVAFIAFEHLVDMLNARCHELLAIVLFSLDGVGAVIQRKKQEIETEAQRNDSGTGISVYDMKSDAVYNFKKQLQRAKQQLIDCLQNGHRFFSPVL